MRRGVADTVGGEQREVKVAGNLDGGLVAGFFLAVQVALEFDVDVVSARRSR